MTRDEYIEKIEEICITMRSLGETCAGGDSIDYALAVLSEALMVTPQELHELPLSLVTMGLLDLAKDREKFTDEE